ncbi:MAG: DUF6270 domain-containing protein, partial [Lacisediminimonas sp.]|nr:DUF6270 domain-containing protein [Lacisediminimonas sp.]
IPSNWQRAMVRADLEKQAYSIIRDSRPSGIVVDFIDERFHLLERHGTVATLSLALSNLLNENYGDAKLVRVQSDRYKVLWEKGWSAFAELVRIPVNVTADSGLS